jgi:hypothetical protein
MGTLVKLALVAVLLASVHIAGSSENDTDDGIGDGDIEIETAGLLELNPQAAAHL